MARTSSTSNSKASVTRNTKGTAKAAATDVAAETIAAATTIVESTPAAENAEPARPVATYQVKEELDPNMYVTVRNGFNGKLVYKSRKSGERYVWKAFGDEQDMELRELRAAKTSYKSFFENNWFMFDDPEIVAYLGVERFYKDALSYEEFDTLFEKSPEEIDEKIKLLSKGQKLTLAFRARQLIRDGGIDSIKVINTLERALDIELIER